MPYEINLRNLQIFYKDEFYTDMIIYHICIKNIYVLLSIDEFRMSTIICDFYLQNPEPELQKMLHSEMEQRLSQLQQRVTTLKTESEEVWKTLETAEASLTEMLTAKDYDCSSYFGENGVPTSKPPEMLQSKLRADRQETEDFYLAVSCK